MAGHQNSTELCPTATILEKIRQDGFDLYGLRNLKKMIKCIVKHEVQCGDAAYYCRKDLQKVWMKCRDDPFSDDFGVKAIREAQTQCRNCEEQEALAIKNGAIDKIRQIIGESENNHKTLVNSKYDLGLVAMMKHRTNILREIKRSREAYYYCWKMALSMKEREKELTARNRQRFQNSDAPEEMKVQLEKMRMEYKKYIQTEQNERPFFLKLCRATRTTLMRHELELFLKKKEAYSMAADWLEKTSLVKSQGGAKNGMVVFLRKQSHMMNAKQFVEGWLKINCEEVAMPLYEEYDPMKDDVKRPPSPVTSPVKAPLLSANLAGDKEENKGNTVIKSSSNPDIPIATDQVLKEAKEENLPCESYSLHTGLNLEPPSCDPKPALPDRRVRNKANKKRLKCSH
ncbi:uncharacterized protein LOC135467452 [Liolophura sinensis]|uniref:uncharacterized protein LOC135467452 n=1 Tax=Liolophura sinensis TaxID=3198878 RepID=UPI0031593354